MLGCISSTHQFFFSRPYFLSIKQWPFIKLYMKLCFHLPLEGTYFGGSCPLVTSLSRNPSPASLTYMNTFPERICQLFFPPPLLPDFSRKAYFQALGMGATESLHRFC